MVGVKDGIEYEFIKGDAESKINLVFIHVLALIKTIFSRLLMNLSSITDI